MSSNVKALQTDSRVQKAEVIAALLQGRSVKEIAEITGIPRGRILRWTNEDPEFTQMLAEVEDSIVAAILDEARQQTVDTVSRLGPRAAEVLAESLEAGDIKVRLAGAQAVLRFAKPERAASGGKPSVEGILRGMDGASPASAD